LAGDFKLAASAGVKIAVKNRGAKMAVKAYANIPAVK
jgi:hypothetical protein